MLIVGIAGGTGSGKTTVVKKILNLLPADKVSVIPQDSYYKDSSHIPWDERKEINFDHPDSIEWNLLIEHIQMLKSGMKIQQPVYSYLTCSRSENTIPVEPHQVVIIEGIMVLTQLELTNLMDIKVFVDADADDRLSRVIQRDVEERGRTSMNVLERYQKTVKPMHLQFIEPSKRNADLIVPQGGDNKVAIELIASIITKHLEKKSYYDE